MRALPLILAALAVPLAPVGAADLLVLPSGAQAQALPVIWDEDISSIRLRYVVEGLVDVTDADEMERLFADMTWLCKTQIAPLFAEGADPRDEGWGGVVVTLMDREVEFGVVDAGSVQMFEWFSVEDTGCERDWDAYAD